MDISELSNTQYEAGLIATLMYHPEFILHTEDLLPGHFYEMDNSCLYWSIQELYKDGITNIDAYNISSKLQSNKGVSRTIEKYNLPSIQECFELYKQVARHTLEEYLMLADNVKALAFRRDMVKTLNQCISDCFNLEKDLEQLDNDVHRNIDGVTEKFVTSGEIQTIGDGIDMIWEEIEGRRTEDGIYGIPSKYPSFGNFFTYEPGELVVVQAKYKQGKSVILMNEAAHKVKNGVPTLVVDSEMPTRLYVERLLSHLSGVEVKKIKTGQMTDDETERVTQCRAWLKGQPFVHIYDPNITNERLYSICKMLQRSMNLQFVIFDYLKSNETSTSDNYNVLGAKCDYLKNNIAGELGLAVLAACQLNRNGEVADSIKINRYLSVGIKWGFKTQEMIAKDGIECGNAFAIINPNRLGEQMPEDGSEYIDFVFDGNRMSIVEAKQHISMNEF